MNNKSFALLVVAILAIAGAGGAIALKPEDNRNYDEVQLFLDISKVPRISEYDVKIGDYLVKYAEDNGLPCQRDSVGNVMIEHPGRISSGIILQSHMDMVGVTDPLFVHDFTNDSLSVVIKNGIITAEHTSLGADDGTGMAICLAALVSNDFTNYSFKCIFTVDEETDMKGAKNMSADWLEGCKYMINIDNEVEGEFLFGSAGAYKMQVEKTFDTVQRTSPNVYGFFLHDLMGGHSGICIDKNRGNAILLSMEFLDQFTDVQIISVEGGQASNSIPDSCYVVFSCKEDADTVQRMCQIKIDEWKSKYADVDLKADFRQMTGYNTALSTDVSKDIIKKVLSIPNGMKEKYEDWVLTSSNLGVMDLTNGKMSITVHSRSAIEDRLEYYENALIDLFGRDNVTVLNKNPSWLGDASSDLCATAMGAYKSITGKDATLAITHGTLESAFYIEKNPDMQIISLGPTVVAAHSINESVSLDSFHTTKLLVFEMMKRLV